MCCRRTRTGWKPTATIRCGKDRKSQVRLASAPDQCSDAHGNADVDRGDQRGKRGVDDGATDDDVDAVQPVLEDRDAAGDRNGDTDARLEDGIRQRLRIRGREPEGKGRRIRNQGGDNGKRKPLDLLPLVAGRPPVANHDARAGHKE